MIPYYAECGSDDIASPTTRLGVATKSDVHSRGLWHRSCLLLVARGGKLLTYVRGTDQSWPGRIDVPGGHEDEADCGSIVACAAREASEELRLMDKGQHVAVRPHMLKPLRPNALVVDSPLNRESAYLFAIVIPRSVDVRVWDEGSDGVGIERTSAFRSLEGIVHEYRADRERFADGLARMLDAVTDALEWRAAVEHVLACRCWALHYTCTDSCGCSDSDFYARHDVVGSREEAEKEARRISREQYYGDFVYRIEED